MGLKPDNSYTSQLQAILRIAHDLREVAAAFLPSSHSSSVSGHCPTIIDSIKLPSPQPIFPSLVEAGFDHRIVVAADKLYLQRAEELRHHIQESIFATWRKITEIPACALASSPDVIITKVVSTSTDIYLRRLERWKEDIIQRIKQGVDTPSKVTPKGSFNYEYVPLLERFFEENPFPTHADKMFLAKKSNMQYRQIHVWFQNRRNRTKKEGKVLQRKPAREEAMKSRDNPYEQMNGHTVQSNFQTSKAPEVSSSKETTAIAVTRKDTIEDALASSSPPHAFPSYYPPTCYYDPFPCKNGPVHFSQPQWRHVSSRKLPLTPSISVDELVDKFSQLNVRDELRFKESNMLQTQAATSAITVIPSRAPHPSLLPCKYQQPANTAQPYPIVRASVSNSKLFQSPGPMSRSLTLVPPSNRIELPGQRRTALLPQRVPGKVGNTCCDTSSSESSWTSPASPRLFSPDPESRSCSFSSVCSPFTPS